MSAKPQNNRTNESAKPLEKSSLKTLLLNQFYDLIGAISNERHKYEINKISGHYKRTVGDLKGKITNLEQSSKAAADAAYLIGWEKRGWDDERLLALQAKEALEKRKLSESYIVSDNVLGFTAAHRIEFRKQLQDRAIAVTDDQFELIMCNEPKMISSAAAGSGKSTTVVLRLVALHILLGVPLKRMCVLSFTRKSRADLISKVCEQFAKWDVEIDETEAKRIVRTFHSMMLPMFQATHLGYQVLEQMDKKTPKAQTDQPSPDASQLGTETHFADEADELYDQYADTDNAITGEAVNVTNADPKAFEILRSAFRATAADPKGRSALFKLFACTHSVSKATDKSSNGAALARTINLDDETFAKAAESVWASNPNSPMWRLPDVFGTPQKSTLAPFALPDFNGTFGWGYVVYSGKSDKQGDQEGAELIVVLGAQVADIVGKLPAPKAMRTYVKDYIPQRNAFFAQHCRRDVLVLETEKAIEDFVQMIEFDRDASRTKAGDMPLFQTKSSATDFGSDSVLNVFIQTINHIQSVGLPLAQALGKAKNSALGLNPFDLALAHAVELFWGFFENELNVRAVRTYNQIFSHFSHENRAAYEALNIKHIQCFEHLFVDEFQDISGLIVSWIKGCKQALGTQGRSGSITVIGDARQSIYSFRGAAPNYFTEFDQYFPSLRPVYNADLFENFRSSQIILDHAAKAITSLNIQSAMPVVAKGKNALLQHKPEFIKILTQHKKGSISEGAVQQIIAATELEVNQFYGSKTDRVKPSHSGEKKVMILCRTKSEQSAIEKGLKHLSAYVEVLTMHASKGLEAESVIAVGDCAAFGDNPLRNAVNQQAGLPSYDQLQSDDALRLGYVAITRAKKRFQWFAKPRDEAVFLKVCEEKPDRTIRG
jgi:superfamily I DNA/RNA helicase